jgi:hypothetical protein
MGSKLRLKWVLILTVLFSALLICVIHYKLISKPLPVFLTTSSPEKTYTVSLKGQKTQPLFFTVEVRFDVFKNGTPLLSDKFLYSADGLDFPFENQYPNHRWINEQSIKFYREEDFRERASNTMVVVNKSGKTIRFVQIESIDIVLIFEIQPGSAATIVTSRLGGADWFSIEGEFDDGRSIEGLSGDLPGAGPTGVYSYEVSIASDKTTIKARN